MKRIKIWVGILTLIITNSFMTNTSHATSIDAITLESISAVSTTVLTGENIVMQLEVAVSTGYDWDPNVTALGGKISLLFCPTSRYSESTGAASCSFTGTSATLFTISTIGTVSSRTSGQFDFKSFTMSGTLNSGEINSYKLFRIRIPAGNIPDRSELHTYLRGQVFAQELGSDRTDITVPTFLNADVSVVEPTPTPTPTPTISETPTPTPTPTISESAPETPSASQNNSSVSVNSSSSSAVSVTKSSINPIAIEASGRALKRVPSARGDLTWNKSREITTKNKSWEIKKNRKASGGRYISSSTNRAKLTISTSGDAFTLRFMTGKNIGKFQINVDGKKLAEINTKSLLTKSKAKSWIGIGPGKHKIEIIPILDPGQSVGIDAYQIARAV
ncbi:MAG: hypothetical protein FJW84_01855 [Actinobacteria bacterium]|nr:hypothetical protein [Actinomycetota bacterium]